MLKKLLVLVFLVPALVSCGGGGSSSAPTASGSLSGSLIVSPANGVEIEPNQSLSEAQNVNGLLRISGRAAAGDPAFSASVQPALDIQDLYRLTTTGPVRITLILAEDTARQVINLDLFLLDSTGTPLASSEGTLGTELIETATAGDFLVGVRALRGSSAYVLAIESLQGLAGFAPGEVLVKRSPLAASALQTDAGFGQKYNLQLHQTLPGGVERFQLTPPQFKGLAAGAAPAAVAGRSLEKSKADLPGSDRNALLAQTLDVVRQLQADTGVIFAEPNYVRKPLLIPADPFFNLQWHYRLINLPQAWDITTGSDSVTVAVLDTGVLTAHPDLSGRLTSGFDFISSTQISNDGDGLDSDPNDPGDDPSGFSSSFHGTHVAGTLGAMANNGAGGSGVTWQTRIMPLRVLGVGGGLDSDIAQAIRYAAGLQNSSNTVPIEPARIITMSFGGPAASQTVNAAIQAARSQGVILVAAAGNSNLNTPFFPAAFDGVLSVSAVDINSQKAAYSNFGSTIDLAAPGGSSSTDSNGDGFPDGVLSTTGDDRGGFLYRFNAGTSMAAPHVAGVAALMLAVNSNLGPQDLEQLLNGTHPDTATRITRDLGLPGRDNVFGQGLIDASRALGAAGEVIGGTSTPPVGSILSLSTLSLSFDNFLNSLSFDVTNAGIDNLTISSITADVPWLSVSPASGTAPLSVTLSVNRAGLPDGLYNGTLTVVSDATQGPSTATLSLSMKVGGATLGNIGTTFVLALNEQSLETIGQAETSLLQNYSFSLSALPAGRYLIIAGTDRDGDNFICDTEDSCGIFPDPVTIEAGQAFSNIDFVVGELLSPQELSPVMGKLAGQKFRRLH